MSGLAEDDLGPKTLARRLLPLGVLVGLVLLGWGAWWLKGQLGIESRPQRQVARISVLPDTPPPPPPPPKEMPKPTPREEAAPKPEAAPKEAAPEAAPLKMEGAAGDGPSAFAAGTVTRELGAAPPAAAPAPTATDRMQERLYAQSTRQLLTAEIERHLRGEAVDLTASFALWLRRDGSIERFEILPGIDPAREPDLRSALDEAARSLRLPQPPAALPQPLRYRLTVRPLG